MRLLLHMRLGLLEDAMLVRRSYVKANPWFMSQTVFHATPLGVRYVRSLDESLDITDLLHS